MKSIKKYPVTYALLTLILLVYCYTSMTFGMNMNAMQAIDVGGFNPLLVLYDHQYYRLLTANLIHFSLVHIVLNSYALYNLMRIIESVFKRRDVIALTVVSALTTTMVPLLIFCITNDGATSVQGGASGIVYGMLGALGVIAYKNKQRNSALYKNIVINLIIMVVVSVTFSGISLWGHVGGFIGGVFYVVTVININKKKNIINKRREYEKS